MLWTAFCVGGPAPRHADAIEFPPPPAYQPPSVYGPSQPPSVYRTTQPPSVYRTTQPSAQSPSQLQFGFASNLPARRRQQPAAAGGQIPRFAPPPPEGFPSLPPDPQADQGPWLPPLEQELREHGGAHLYCEEGDAFQAGGHHHGEHPVLRIPANSQTPQPFTLFSDFLGTGQIRTADNLRWPGCDGYHLEPRFVGYGSYELFGFAFQQDGRRQDGIGHQLLVDLDLRLTGTERFHVQFRPLGRRDSGGSYYQFDPARYQDNSTALPDRFWVEGELASLLGGFLDPFAAWDWHVAAGQFPFAAHNSLLINDDILGVVVSKNNVRWGSFSNLNLQFLYAFNEVDAFADAESAVYGTHATADLQGAFYEASYFFLQHERVDNRNAHFAALSATRIMGAVSVAGRAFSKWGDSGGSGSGQLLVLESNWTRVFDQQPWGVEYAVPYFNAFLATDGWNAVANANLNRLRTSFEVSPLIRIANAPLPGKTWGAAVGVQLLRHHEDESLAPEFAFEAPDGESVWGLGLRYQRKTSARSFLEFLGLINFSDDPRLKRNGVFLSHSIIF